MKLARTILFDASYEHVFAHAADEGEWALTIFELDEEPPANALKAIVEDPDIEEARVSRQG